MSIFGRRLKYVTGKMWYAGQTGYPEKDDPEFKVEEMEGRPNVGLAFSGGGTRSASATLGQLRGLAALDLLKKTRYISCVSGGSWACVPFTYLPSNWPDKTFLGQIIPPQDVTTQYLQQTDRNSLAHAIANSEILDKFCKDAIQFAGDETFARAVGDIFLNSFGLDSAKHFFSLNQQTVTKIIEHNPAISPSDFHLVRPGRPYLIVNSIILRPENPPPLPRLIHVESTPQYTGARVLHKGAGSRQRDIGGGYIEPFCFDSDAPEGPPDQHQRVRVRLGISQHRYTLADVIGTSGAAPAEVLAKLGLDWIGLPEFKHWPLSDTGKIRAREYAFGDGGILENLGVMPLLMRKVDRIIIFVNTKDELGGRKDEINTSIPPLFGQVPSFGLNHVFPTDQYDALVEGFQAAKEAGATVMFRDRYRVKENRHYGIEGGWEADVLWVYNERVPAWEKNLRADIRRLIGVGSLGNFPHYKTFFQNPPAVIDLSAKQVHMLAHLSCWNIIENQNLFRAMFS